MEIVLLIFVAVVFIGVVVASNIITTSKEGDLVTLYRNSSPKALKERLRNVKRLVKSHRFKWVGKIGKTKPDGDYEVLESIDEATFLSQHHGGKGIPIYWVTIEGKEQVTISIDGHILMDSNIYKPNKLFLFVDNSIKNAIRFLDEEEDRNDD